jgi:hypothetical protein
MSVRQIALLLATTLAGCAEFFPPDTDVEADTDTDTDTDADTDTDTDADTDADADILINEVLSNNGDGVLDDNGENEDWVELYNTSDQAVDISGWLFTDDLDRQDSWAFADGTIIEPDTHLLLWCDADVAQGDLHTDFGIAREGESLVLMNPTGQVMNRVEVPPLELDSSYGRRADGVDQWTIFSEPTPGESND